MTVAKGQGAIRDGGEQGLAVVLVLRGSAERRQVGRAVDVGIEIRNEGKDVVWFVGAVDGSEEGVRYPHYRPTITRDGTVVAAPPRPEDPLVGPMRAADFRGLRPGESFDPTRGGAAAYHPLATFATFRPSEPGFYRYLLTISTVSTRPEEWLGAFGQDAERAAVLDLIARVPRLEITSNVLEVDVR